MASNFFSKTVFLTLSFIFLLLIVIPFISSANTLPGTILEIFIGPERECKNLHNFGQRTLFVPTRTTREWESFKAVANLFNIKIDPCAEVIPDIARDLVEEDLNAGLLTQSQANKILSCVESERCSDLSDYETTYAQAVLAKAENDAELINAQDLLVVFEKRFDEANGPYDYITYEHVLDNIDLINDWKETFKDDPEAFATMLKNNNLESYVDAEGNIGGQDCADYTLIRAATVLSAQDTLVTSLEEKSDLLGTLETNLGDYLNCVQDGDCDYEIAADESGDITVDVDETTWVSVYGTGTETETCFTSGTLIKTSNGDKQISDLTAGEYVLSYDVQENKFVKSKIEKLLVHKYSTEWYYLIKTANSQVEVTDAHRFYIGNNEYKKAKNLQVGDTIYTNINGKIIEEKILSQEIVTLPKFITVYNLELEKESPHNYFAGNYLVHNAK